MIVKKFKEFINEGFLSKTLNRAKTGVERKEDQLPPNNLKDLKEVDLHPSLPFVFADEDLEFNGSNKLTGDDVYTYIDKIEESGWRLPSRDDMQELCKVMDSNDVHVIGGGFDDLIITCLKKIITYSWRYGYVIRNYPKSKREMMKKPQFERTPEYVCIKCNDNSSYFSFFSTIDDVYPKHVKLIKDKKVNEGFLSKTLNRAKTGEERKEDKINSNIDELKTIDLGYVQFADVDIEIEGKTEFSFYEMVKYNEYFNKHGWKVFDFDTALKLIKDENIGRSVNEDKNVVLYNKNTNEKVEFVIACPADDTAEYCWWLDNLHSKSTKREPDNGAYGNAIYISRDGEHVDINYEIEYKTHLLPIRLIRK